MSVYRRGDDWAARARAEAAPQLALICVGEDDLESCLRSLPDTWRDRVGLVQNELRPSAWRSLGPFEPTVLSVWFERKANRPPTAVRGSVAMGPNAELLVETLLAEGMPAEVAAWDRLEFELCLKNLYILALNFCGLRAPGTAGELLGARRHEFEQVRDEVLAVEQAAFGRAARLPSAELARALDAALAADTSHGLAGRTAARRLERCLALADHFGLEVPRLRALAPVPSS